MSVLQLDVRDAAIQAFSWWRGELSALVPATLRGGRRKAPHDVIALVRGARLSPAGHETDIADTGSDSPGEQTSASAQFAEAELLAAISRQSTRRPARVVLRLRERDCLVRRIDVPRTARADIARIAALDLERATPFRPADVVSAVVVDPDLNSRSRLHLRQLIVKRTVIDALTARVEDAGGEVVSIDCLAADGATVLPADFLAQTDAAGTGAGNVSTGRGALLAALVASLLLGAAAVTISRSEMVLAELQAETAALRSRLADARAVANAPDTLLNAAAAFERVRERQPSPVLILEDLSRRIPDSAWLTEVRMTRDTLDLSGYARPAASLAPLLERSAFVETATLTAPIVMDTAQARERFSLRLKIRAATARDLAPASSLETGAP